MFMGIFRSKKSPLYWLIRFFWKDLAKTSDIDEDRFRMMILPGSGYDLKALCKEGKAIFVNILDIPATTMQECFQQYHNLAVAAAGVENNGWRTPEEHINLRDFKLQHFIFEVTEDEHDAITSYLSGKGVFVITLDELANLRRMAKEEAEYAVRNRTMAKFIDQASAEMEEAETIGDLVNKQMG